MEKIKVKNIKLENKINQIIDYLLVTYPKDVLLTRKYNEDAISYSKSTIPSFYLKLSTNASLTLDKVTNKYMYMLLIDDMNEKLYKDLLKLKLNLKKIKEHLNK